MRSALRDFDDICNRLSAEAGAASFSSSGLAPVDNILLEHPVPVPRCWLAYRPSATVTGAVAPDVHTTNTANAAFTTASSITRVPSAVSVSEGSVANANDARALSDVMIFSGRRRGKVVTQQTQQAEPLLSRLDGDGGQRVWLDPSEIPLEGMYLSSSSSSSDGGGSGGANEGFFSQHEQQEGEIEALYILSNRDTLKRNEEVKGTVEGPGAVAVITRQTEGNLQASAADAMAKEAIPLGAMTGQNANEELTYSDCDDDDDDDDDNCAGDNDVEPKGWQRNKRETIRSSDGKATSNISNNNKDTVKGNEGEEKEIPCKGDEQECESLSTSCNDRRGVVGSRGEDRRSSSDLLASSRLSVEEVPARFQANDVDDNYPAARDIQSPVLLYVSPLAGYSAAEAETPACSSCLERTTSTPTLRGETIDTGVVVGSIASDDEGVERAPGTVVTAIEQTAPTTSELKAAKISSTAAEGSFSAAETSAAIGRSSPRLRSHTCEKTRTESKTSDGDGIEREGSDLADDDVSVATEIGSLFAEGVHWFKTEESSHRSKQEPTALTRECEAMTTNSVGETNHATRKAALGKAEALNVRTREYPRPGSPSRNLVSDERGVVKERHDGEWQRNWVVGEKENGSEEYRGWKGRGSVADKTLEELEDELLWVWGALESRIRVRDNPVI